MRIQFIILFAAVLGMTSCKTQQVPLEEYSQSIITFGNEGGFTGKATTYKILEDGRSFYQGPRDKAFALADKLDKKVVTQLFSSFNDLGVMDLELNDPGNLTYFIHVDRPEKLKKSFKWGAEIKPVDPKIKALYMNMIHMVKKPLKTPTANR